MSSESIFIYLNEEAKRQASPAIDVRVGVLKDKCKRRFGGWSTSQQLAAGLDAGFSVVQNLQGIPLLLEEASRSIF